MTAIHNLTTALEATGRLAPWLFLALFLIGSLLMIWRLEAMGGDGLEGTVLGTLVMPYCSGAGNLIFAYVLARRGGDGAGAEVLTNCVVNNVTNMTLLIGAAAVVWGLSLAGERQKAKGKGQKAGNGEQNSPAQRVNRLSLLLTLTAVFFFTGLAWVLGRDGKLDATDGLVLIGAFFFWQVFHVFEVLKSNATGGKNFSWMLPVDLALLVAGAGAVYVSTDWLVNWVQHGSGFVSARHLGWLSGWLMVLPNGLLAFYYAWRRRAEIVYASQVGDGHVCIPFCLGIFALHQTFAVPASFTLGCEILAGATAVHFLCVALFGKLPRAVGLGLLVGYGWFCFKGLK
jgi:cation:H+ antiporter